MRFAKSLMAVVALGVMAIAGQASAGVNCGMNTGTAATGALIVIGGI
jgi:hypothetical protein